MNPLQQAILRTYKKLDYPFNPISLRDTLDIKPSILRRNAGYLAQKGFLKQEGFRTQVNGLVPLYRITERGRKALDHP